jgi:hypothetical protein
VVEGPVADVVDGAVPGQDDDLGEHVLIAVHVGLIQGEFGPQGGGGGGAEAIVPRRIDAGVEGVHQFRHLVAAGGVDGVNVEAVVQHVLDGPPVPFRQDAQPLVKGGDPLGMVPQGLQGVEGQEVDHPFAAARAQGVLAGIELGKHEEHLVIEGQPVHQGARSMVLSQARNISGIKSRSCTLTLSTMRKASVGQTWTQTPQPLQEAGSASRFMAKRSQGMPLGGFLKTLK